MDFKNSEIIGSLILAVVVALIIGVLIRQMYAERGRRDEMRARELAEMVEEVRLTWVGALCPVLLVIVAFVAAAGYARAVTILQQIEAGIAFLGAAVILGLGVAVGRRRTYRIYRSDQREPL